MTRAELNTMIMAMQAGTAMSRLNLSEMHTAFDWAMSHKYLPPLIDDEPHPYPEQPAAARR